jgi:hypothetical protein
LSIADAGSSGCSASCSSMKLQVSGMICITPRAPAPDTTELLKELSFHAIDWTSGADIPYSEAIDPTSSEVTTSSVG